MTSVPIDILRSAIYVYGMIVRPTTAGAQALDAYLRTGGTTLHAFCDAHGIDYAQAHRNMSGARGKRVSIDFAAAIERASGIPARLWCQGTLHPDKTTARAVVRSGEEAVCALEPADTEVPAGDPAAALLADRRDAAVARSILATANDAVDHAATGTGG